MAWILKDFAYSDSEVGLTVTPKLKKHSLKEGGVAERHQAKSSNKDMGVAKVSTEKSRYEKRKKIEEKARRQAEQQ